MTKPIPAENDSIATASKVERDELPALPFKNRSFLSFLGTQALGAFNDNVFKQLVLLLGVGYTLAGIEYQAVVQFLLSRDASKNYAL